MCTKNATAPMIAMLDCSELDTEVSDTGIETTESNDCREVSKKAEIPMVCWLQYEKEWDFPPKMDRSLSTYLPSQSVDCVRQTSCIQGPKSKEELSRMT